MPMTIVHANDAAAVAKNLVRIGKKHGVASWHRVPILPAKIIQSGSPLLKVGSYGYSVAAELFARSLASQDKAVLHIHGGHLWKFCLRTSGAFVLHIHGSDVRGFSSDGNPRSRVPPGTREAILRAQAVVFSTPELGPIVRAIRPDATWLPSPITPFSPPRVNRTQSNSFADVFFPHEWMEDKGLESGFAQIERIRSATGKSLRVVGLKIGPSQELALRNGIELVRPVSRLRHFERLLNSKVVLSQGHGALYSLNDLEAMSIGANFIPVPLQTPAREAYGSMSSDGVINSLDESVALAVSYLNLAPQRTALNFASILDVHSDSRIFDEVTRVYQSLKF